MKHDVASKHARDSQACSIRATGADDCSFGLELRVVSSAIPLAKMQPRLKSNSQPCLFSATRTAPSPKEKVQIQTVQDVQHRRVRIKQDNK